VACCLLCSQQAAKTQPAVFLQSSRALIVPPPLPPHTRRLLEAALAQHSLSACMWRPRRIILACVVASQGEARPASLLVFGVALSKGITYEQCDFPRRPCPPLFLSSCTSLHAASHTSVCSQKGGAVLPFCVSQPVGAPGVKKERAVACSPLCAAAFLPPPQAPCVVVPLNENDVRLESSALMMRSLRRLLLPVAAYISLQPSPRSVSPLHMMCVCPPVVAGPHAAASTPWQSCEAGFVCARHLLLCLRILLVYI
jgi:hypothetical protein